MWSLRSSLLDLQSQLLDLKSESERLEVRLRGFRSKTFGDSEEGSVNDMTSTESEMESLASGTRSEVHSGAASSVSCQKPLSTLRSESFRHLLERQVEFGFVRRDESYITSIFQRYANPFPDGSLKILKENLLAAFNDLDISVPDGSEGFESMFCEIDVNKDRAIDQIEFLRAVGATSIIESWAKSIPWWQPIADSFPKLKGGSDPLRNLALLSQQEIDIICEVISKGTSKMLIEHVKILRDSYASLDSKALCAADDKSKKFKTHKLCCGRVEDYHQGLKGRIGRFFLGLLFQPVRMISLDIF